MLAHTIISIIGGTFATVIIDNAFLFVNLQLYCIGISSTSLDLCAHDNYRRDVLVGCGSELVHVTHTKKIIASLVREAVTIFL